jgi:phosphopantetheine adenylyltransferase
MAKTVAFTFGRFNPPTTGHEKLLDATRKVNSNYRVYTSQSQDPKKNPLDFKNKVSVMKSMFPTHSRSISTNKVTTAIDVMVNLYKEKYTDVTMVVGSDRVSEFEKLLNAYNGKKARHGYYKFNSIRVVSAGERDPDAEGVSGMSASKMRQAVQDNDYDSFSKGLPKKFKGGRLLFKILQKAMGVKSIREWIETTPEKIEEETIIEEQKTDMIESFKDRLYKKEYQAAANMYKQFIKRGDSSGEALHRAASSFRHVSERGLRDFLNR